jgi:FlaA1/EpsC-like NDP-sugar epimerase
LKKLVQTHLFQHSKESRMRGFLLGVLDGILILAVMVTSLLIRFDFRFHMVDPVFWDSIIQYMPYGFISTIIIFIICKLYSSMWRYCGHGRSNPCCFCMHFCNDSSVCDYLCHAAAASKKLLFLILFSTVDRSGNPSFQLSFLKEHFKEERSHTEERCHPHHIPVCLIDDDPNKKGIHLHGIPVIGNRSQIKSAVEEYKIQEIILAIPSMEYKNKKEILNICKDTNCMVKILPGIYQIINEEVSVSKLREVEIEDLLGREPIPKANEHVASYVKDQVVVVTGGGGSIGSELCRQIAQYEPKRLIILDNYENNAYALQMELIRKYPQLDLVVLIVSVQNKRRIHNIFQKYKPQLVFHAAAHKHVPLMENSPCDAIRNNVFGTMNVAMEASLCGTKRMVLISTDKAVRPTNIMGASKRICELVIQYFNEHSETEYMAVRFGNVLGSNGSVVPLFRKQIQEGGPVTVTHPDIIRYFMMIPEAVNLVLEAGAYAHGGEIFILDMGEPVKILDLAENMIRLSGYVPYDEIKIVFTGLRPGEKLYEELLISEKNKVETDNERIFIAQLPPRDQEEFKVLIKELKETAFAEDNKNIRKVVQKLVPEYTILTEQGK